MRVTVVHNPSAGTGRPSPEELVAALRSVGHDVAYQSRKEPGLEEAIANPADAIVLAGGDGTVGKLLHLLVPRGLPVAILPLGTANNLARSLGVRDSVEAIARRWRPDRLVHLDVGVARGAWGERLFIDSAGAGAISQGMREADRADPPPGTDKLAGARARIRDCILRAPAGGLEVIADGQALPPDILLAEATNVAYLGPGLPVAPAANPSDGLLDLVYAREGDRAALAEWLCEGRAGEAPLSALRARSVMFQRPAGTLRIGDAFEPHPGPGSVAAISARGLALLLS